MSGIGFRTNELNPERFGSFWLLSVACALSGSYLRVMRIEETRGNARFIWIQ